MAKLVSKCPCGKGIVERSVFHFGNSTIFEPLPRIICPKCSKEYKVISLDRLKSNQDQGRNSKCYLVPISFDSHIKYQNDIKPIKENEMTNETFSNYIACLFSKEKLLIALQEFKDTDDKICLRNYAKTIYLKKKAYLFDDEIANLIDDVNEAIELYDSYQANYDKLKHQEIINKKIEEKFYKQVEKIGILFTGKYHY